MTLAKLFYAKHPRRRMVRRRPRTSRSFAFEALEPRLAARIAPDGRRVVPDRGRP